ncbi:MAG: archease [Desulfobacterales bacterium]|nr:archease [Desulfobacterales bacterium]
MQPLTLIDAMAGPEDACGPVRFEEVEHTADRALRIYGTTWEGFLVNAAHGLNSILAPSPSRVAGPVAKEVDLEAIDRESLLVAWLSELAYWAEVESLVFDRFDFIDLTPEKVRASIRGGVAERLGRNVKAVTYHGLAIIETSSGFSATVVFDV